VRDIQKERQSIVLLFVGDIMLDRGVEWQIQQHGYDWRWPFLKIAETLHEADFVFGNLESQISDKGTKVGSIYSFRADPKTIEGLAFAGFDALSVANNHSFDYGVEAFLDSLERLKEANISYIGGGIDKEDAHSPLIKKIKGTRVGFLGYTNLGSPLWQATDNTSGIAWVDEDTLLEFQEDIKRAKEQSDILAVSLHFGEEYQKEPSPMQQLLSKTAIDAGANLVIGHHTHVAQPVEQHKHGWIAYSLGNFVFDQGFSAETMEGLMLKVIVKNKKIREIIPLKTKLNPSFQVELMAE